MLEATGMGDCRGKRRKNVHEGMEGENKGMLQDERENYT